MKFSEFYKLLEEHGGEKMEVAGTSIMCIQTTITSSRWADTLRKMNV